MEFVRKHKKISITVLIVLFIILILGFAYGRYLYNIINNYILETKAFYFNSSVLGINNNKYLVNNWDGVNSYTLTINVNNMKNSLVSTDSDITYETYVECSTNVTCTVSKQNGVIYKNDGTKLKGKFFESSVAGSSKISFESGINYNYISEN